jgi:hypothetical protein
MPELVVAGNLQQPAYPRMSLAKRWPEKAEMYTAKLAMSLETMSWMVLGFEPLASLLLALAMSYP